MAASPVSDQGVSPARNLPGRTDVATLPRLDRGHRGGLRGQAGLESDRGGGYPGCGDHPSDPGRVHEPLVRLLTGPVRAVEPPGREVCAVVALLVLTSPPGSRHRGATRDDRKYGPRCPPPFHPAP